MQETFKKIKEKLESAQRKLDLKAAKLSINICHGKSLVMKKATYWI